MIAELASFSESAARWRARVGATFVAARLDSDRVRAMLWLLGPRPLWQRLLVRLDAQCDGLVGDLLQRIGNQRTAALLRAVRAASIGRAARRERIGEDLHRAVGIGVAQPLELDGVEEGDGVEQRADAGLDDVRFHPDLSVVPCEKGTAIGERVAGAVTDSSGGEAPS